MPRSRQVQGELPAPRGNETQTSHGRVVSVTFDRKKEGRDEAGKKQTVLTKIRSEVAVGMDRPSIEAPKDQKLPPYPHQKACQSCVAGWTPRRGAPVRHRPETPVGNVSCQEAFALTPLFQLFNFIARRSGILSASLSLLSPLGMESAGTSYSACFFFHFQQISHQTDSQCCPASNQRSVSRVITSTSTAGDFTPTKRPVVIGRRLSPCVTGKAVKIPVPRTGMILDHIPDFDAFGSLSTEGAR